MNSKKSVKRSYVLTEECLGMFDKIVDFIGLKGFGWNRSFTLRYIIRLSYLVMDLMKELGASSPEEFVKIVRNKFK